MAAQSTTISRVLHKRIVENQGAVAAQQKGAHKLTHTRVADQIRREQAGQVDAPQLRDAVVSRLQRLTNGIELVEELAPEPRRAVRSEEHTSELQSLRH